MRHRVKGYKLNRTASHRTATLRALATALFKHKKITTTVTKAKAAKMFAEPLITKAKNNTVAARRLVARHIKDREVLQELFGAIAEAVGDRPGGYTRIVKLGNRQGDAAEMAILELVDFNDVGKPEQKHHKKAAEPEVKDAEIIEEKTAEDSVPETDESEVKSDGEEEVKTEETEEEKPSEETSGEAEIKSETDESADSAEEEKEDK